LLWSIQVKDETEFDRPIAPLALGDPPLMAARAARLRYVGDWQPGIIREPRKKGFVYVDRDGKRVRDPETVRRIQALVIPPAWTDVWICADPEGHLQATGRDARRRKQYRYHTRWREIRDENKYARLIAFGETLPRIRKRVEHDLGLEGLPRPKVLATVVKLLESTHIRVGNEEYARANNSFGLATLRNRHVKVSGRKIRFDFRGKSGVQHAISLEDRRLARIIKRCQDLPGYELFQYVADGARVAIEASDVNDYLREIAGAEFSTKDFRTWAGTVLAARALSEVSETRTKTEAKRGLAEAVGAVAKRLGNTKTVCRKCYIHPTVIEYHNSGGLTEFFAKQPHRSGAGLSRDESGLLALLRRQEQAAKKKTRLARDPYVNAKVARVSSVFR
jgi:DNA topoisomerase-1